MIVQLRKITAGLDEAIARRRRDRARRARRSTSVVTTINEQLDAGVDLLEGLLVKKAGLTDAVGLVDGLYPGAAAAGLRNFPESTTIRRRASARSTRGARSRSRGSAARRRSPPATRRARCSGT